MQKVCRNSLIFCIFASYLEIRYEEAPHSTFIDADI